MKNALFSTVYHTFHEKSNVCLAAVAKSLRWILLDSLAPACGPVSPFFCGKSGGLRCFFPAHVREKTWKRKACAMHRLFGRDQESAAERGSGLHRFIIYILSAGTYPTFCARKCFPAQYPDGLEFSLFSPKNLRIFCEKPLTFAPNVAMMIKRLNGRTMPVLAQASDEAGDCRPRAGNFGGVVRQSGGRESRVPIVLLREGP